MNEKRVPKITLDREGNKPASEASLLPYYKANICWPPGMRSASFGRMMLQEYKASA